MNAPFPAGLVEAGFEPAMRPHRNNRFSQSSAARGEEDYGRADYSDQNAIEPQPLKPFKFSLTASSSDGGGELIAPGGVRSGPVALIDSCSLSHECMLESLSRLPGSPEIVSFFSIDACILAQKREFSLIIVYTHVVQGEFLKDLATIQNAYADSALFVISHLDFRTHPHFVRAALKAGVKGLVSTKTTELALALSAMHFVKAGGFFAPLELILGQPSVPDLDQAIELTPFLLTARENAVMALLREGKPNKVIARALTMSSNTVRAHIHNILRKMSVTNRTEAVSKALPYRQRASAEL